jgi:DNA repair protein RAD50
MSKKSEVKASIKMRFCNRGGQPMVCLRSMQVVQKKTSLTFKGLDGVIRMTNKAGEKVSMSHKCSELDKQLPELLGVSKAILENVVFCHQEEANWPLLESAAIKKKFDDIFESSRYAKALEAIRKAKLEKKNQEKDLKRDLDVLNIKLTHVADLNREMSDAQEKIEGVHTSIKRLNEQVIEKQEELDKLQEKQGDVEVSKR